MRVPRTSGHLHRLATRVGLQALALAVAMPALAQTRAPERAVDFGVPMNTVYAQAEPKTDDAKPVASPASGGGVDLEGANQQFANPLASATLFIVENDTLYLQGKATDDWRTTNVTVIEPLIPVPLGDSGWSLVNRPILPIGVGADVPIGPGGTSGGAPTDTLAFDGKNGLGDFTFFSLLTPQKGGGLLWGVGPTMRFPTATDDQLGSQKYSAGPAGVAVYSSPKFTIGTLAQSFNSFAGESDREDVRLLTVQYFGFYNFTPKWGFGTAPIATFNFKEDIDNAASVPVGAGITYTFAVGGTPMRALVEAQYYPINREDFGPRWNLRFALAAFLPPLFGK